MLIFLWIQIYLSKQRGLTTNGWDTDGQPIKAAEYLHSLDEPKIIIYPVIIGGVCIQFICFHLIQLICSPLNFHRARRRTRTHSARVGHEFGKTYFVERKIKNSFFFLLFFDCETKQRTRRRTLWQWMHFGYLNHPDLMRPEGPLLQVFFDQTKAPRLSHWFWSISQREIEQWKWTKNRSDGNFSEKKKREKREKTLLSTIDYYLFWRYLFMLWSPTNSRGSCEYIYS